MNYNFNKRSANVVGLIDRLDINKTDNKLIICCYEKNIEIK